MLCPDCEADKQYVALRCETPSGHPLGLVPDLVCHPSPLGFLLRCERCGYRVQMTGSRVATAAMLNVRWAPNSNTECS